MGRTGKLFAYQNFNITPDIIQIGKGAGGGIPLGGIIVGEKLCDVFAPGSIMEQHLLIHQWEQL